MIHTADQYAQAVATFDQDQAKAQQQMIDRLIDEIPLNINRAGKTYQTKVKIIRMMYGFRN